MNYRYAQLLLLAAITQTDMLYCPPEILERRLPEATAHVTPHEALSAPHSQTRLSENPQTPRPKLDWEDEPMDWEDKPSSQVPQDSTSQVAPKSALPESQLANQAPNGNSAPQNSTPRTSRSFLDRVNEARKSTAKSLTEKAQKAAKTVSSAGQRAAEVASSARKSITDALPGGKKAENSQSSRRPTNDSYEKFSTFKNAKASPLSPTPENPLGGLLPDQRYQDWDDTDEPLAKAKEKDKRYDLSSPLQSGPKEATNVVRSKEQREQTLQEQHDAANKDLDDLEQQRKDVITQHEARIKNLESQRSGAQFKKLLTNEYYSGITAINAEIDSANAQHTENMSKIDAQKAELTAHRDKLATALAKKSITDALPSGKKIENPQSPSDSTKNSGEETFTPANPEAALLSPKLDNPDGGLSSRQSSSSKSDLSPSTLTANDASSAASEWDDADAPLKPRPMTEEDVDTITTQMNPPLKENWED